MLSFIQSTFFFVPFTFIYTQTVSRDGYRNGLSFRMFTVDEISIFWHENFISNGVELLGIIIK